MPDARFRGMTQRQTGELTRQQILDYLDDTMTNEDRTPSITELAAVLERDRVNIRIQITKLIEEGRLTRTGTRKNPLYTIIRNPEEAPDHAPRLDRP